MTFQHKACLVFTCVIGSNMVWYVIYGDRDSRPLTGFNGRSTIQRAVSGQWPCVAVMSMVASCTICVCISKYTWGGGNPIVFFPKRWKELYSSARKEKPPWYHLMWYLMWLGSHGDRSMHFTYIPNQNWLQQLFFVIIPFKFKALPMCTWILFKENVRGSLSANCCWSKDNNIHL